MSHVPRASLSIGLLDDEDYRVLMTYRGGAEAFGVFVAMLLVGRERLQRGKARQLSETESLTIDNSTTHASALARVTLKQLHSCLAILADVARETGSEPWMYADESGHLVIRSFFKFNASSGWGGARAGAGRPPRRNQDEPGGNQAETNLKPTWSASYSYSNSNRVRDAGANKGPPETDPDPVTPDGPVGACSAADVREIAHVANELFPLSSVPTMTRQWAADGHTKAKIVAAMATAHEKARNPVTYIPSLLTDPSFGAPKAPRASPARVPARSRDEVVAELRRREAERSKREGGSNGGG